MLDAELGEELGREAEPGLLMACAVGSTEVLPGHLRWSVFAVGWPEVSCHSNKTEKASAPAQKLIT